MPNWCENEVEFHAESKEQMDELINLVTGKVLVQDSFSGEHHDEDQQFCFNEILPQPKEAEGVWYDWRIENWGTKWEPDVETFDRVSDTWLVVSMLTAWGPPEGIYQELQEKFPALDIEWFYKEPGVQIAGWLGVDHK